MSTIIGLTLFTICLLSFLYDWHHEARMLQDRFGHVDEFSLTLRVW